MRSRIRERFARRSPNAHCRGVVRILMLFSFLKPEPRTFDAGFSTTAGSCRPVPFSARGEHARLLGIAAARRLRAADRLRNDRLEDAEYWIACAPVAVSMATEMRDRLTPLP